MRIARFDPHIPGILFWGPALICYPAEIDVIAAHEWAHAWLWCRGAPWLDEHLADETIRGWGFDPGLLERVRFEACYRPAARFLLPSR